MMPTGFETPGPGAVADLQAGEFTTFTVSRTGSIEIPAASETRSYLVIVHDDRSEPGGAIDVVFQASRVPAAGRFNDLARSVQPPEVRSQAARDPFAHWFEEGENAFRRQAVERLRRVGARPVAAVRTGGGARASLNPNIPTVGQLLALRSPVGGDGGLATCTSTSRVVARVRAVGPHFALVEDTLVAGALTQADYAEILSQVEGVSWPVDSAYFGTPRDLDGNGRVLALVTPEVNRLGAAGFFTVTDLAPAADCPASNEGEILWLIAPDPARQFGFDPIPIGLVKTRLAGIVSHELQHLIHAERRVFEAGGDFDSPDELWLNEGLSHIAEEVSGFYDAGRHTGEDLAFDDLGEPATQERFSRYHLSDFRFVRDYLQNPRAVPALLDDPVTRGQLRRARGFGYLFLRWLADQYASEGAPGLVGTLEEEALFRDLTVGGATLLRSTQNVVAALARRGEVHTWAELFSDYVGMPGVDGVADADIPLDGKLELASWNLPQVYENARANGFALDFPDGFPLRPTPVLLRTIPASGFSAQVRLLPTTGAYFRVEGLSETPLSRISVTSSTGSSLPSGNEIRVTIVRTF